MGCATSKQKVCRKCQEPYSPVRRSYSMHASYHPPQKEGESYHLVALTSSTLGSLKLDLLDPNHPAFKRKGDEGEEESSVINPVSEKDDDNHSVKSRKEEFAVGVIEAKTWSKMIDEKIPKVAPRTPIRTPPGEPETINAWELMEGLEDTSPLRPANHHFRSFSFHVGSNHQFPCFVDDQHTPRVHDDGEVPAVKPAWLDTADSSDSNSNETSIISEFDPEVISAFRKSLEELPPANPFHLKPLMGEQALDGKDEPLEAADHVKERSPWTAAPRGKDRLIVYFTSLRGVRKTYEDCCNVRIILKGLGVKLDERDVSMHSGFKEELKELLGECWCKGGALPKVFIGSRFLGGAEEIRRMHEDGQLEKAVEGCERADDGGGGGGNAGVCNACGDIRFVPCETCCGSCKIYYEGEYEEEECEDAEYGFQRCPDCNENGLTRCPICCG
ncbi:unnamed protein product [Coffea canephora]|uniref:Glutaredoxin domain-containing protein n=1 Tax=Coffea canephora TaxID=49390 RepID=A0A068U1R4_COFCA|nr:unnamed protein product [Coffea canephora]